MLCATVVVAGERELAIWVAPLDNATGDAEYDQHGQAMADILGASLSRSVGVHAVERDRLDALLREQAVTLTGMISDESALKVGRLVAADVIILGSFMREGGGFRIVCHALQTTNAVVTCSAAESAKDRDLLGSCDRLGKTILQALGRGTQSLVRAEIDDAPLANLHFMRGVSRFHANQWTLAARDFMRVLEMGEDQQARYWLGKSYAMAGEWASANLEMERLLRTDPPEPLRTQARNLFAESAVICTAWERDVLNRADASSKDPGNLP